MISGREDDDVPLGCLVCPWSFAIRMMSARTKHPPLPLALLMFRTGWRGVNVKARHAELSEGQKSHLLSL